MTTNPYLIASFSSYINLNLIETYYVESFKKHKYFEDYDWNTFYPTINQFRRLGWLQYEKERNWEMGKLHPLLPFKMRQQLKKQADLAHIQKEEFLSYINALGSFIFGLLDHPKVAEQQEGLLLTQYEYNNLIHAIGLALRYKKSAIVPFTVLQHFHKIKGQPLQSIQLANWMIPIMVDWDFKVLPEKLTVEYIGILDNLGEAYSTMNLVAEAKKVHQAALERLIIAKVNKEKYSYYYGGIHQNLGIAANKMGQLLASKNHFQQALAYYTTPENTFQIANIQLNLGLIARQEKAYNDSKSYLETALIHFKELNQWQSMAQVWQNLGVLADEQGNLAQSLAYYQKALPIFEKFGDTHALAQVEQNLGVIAGVQRRHIDSTNHFQKALALFIELEDGYP